MKLIKYLLLIILLTASVAFAQPGAIHGPYGGGVSVAKDCDVATYYPIGKLCQDSDDGKLYKGTGSGVTEIADGSSGDVTAATTDITWGDGTGPEVFTFSVTGTDPTLTATAGQLAVGGTLALGANNLTMTGSLGATGAGKLTKLWATDLELTNAPTINGAAWTTILQPLNATLTALAAQTESQGALQYYTADATPAVLAKGTAYQLLQMNSGATAPEWTSSLSISALNLTSATSSIPWVVGTASAPTAEGQAYWNSNTDTLTVGNGATATALATTTYKPADLAIASQAAGDVLYFDGTNWVRLAADTGKYLKSGASAVSWDTPTGTGDFKADGSVPFTAALVPNAANTVALGSTSAEIADIYLGDGAIIYGQNDQSNTITSSATGWSFAKPITIADASNDNYIKVTNNTSRAATASVNEIYPEANVWKVNQNGTEYSVAIGPTAEQISFSGTLTNGKACTYATGGAMSCNSDILGLGANTFTAKQTMDATTGLQVGATGVLITSDDDGAITLLGASGGYDEDLTINLDDTENTAVVSSSTGVTKIDYGSIGSATTGIVSGGTQTPVIGDADDFDNNFTGANLYGGTYIVNAAGTVVLPAVAAGMNFTIVLEGAVATPIDPDGTGTADTIYMNGLAAASDENITSSTRGAMCVFQYRAANTWMATCNGFTEATPP